MYLHMFLLGIFLPANAILTDYYTAAVFEHRPRANYSDKSAQEIISINLKYFEKAALIANLKGADILVFNEYGLFPYVKDRAVLREYAEYIPDPKKKMFNPCLEKTTDRPILHTLSCLARENHLYVVANLGDVQPCADYCDANEIDACGSGCPQDGVLMYNANVAFDRAGNLVARYRKVHPYFEAMNVPEGPEMVTFRTEMGTFGLIVCFDSVFEGSFRLAREHGIDAMIFPTFWFDDIVPLNAVEWQQSWALANGVDFIAANSQTSGTGSLGSGIYSRHDGALVYTFAPDGHSKLLVANLKIGNSALKIPTDSSVTVVTEHGAFAKEEETGDDFPLQCFETDPAKSIPLLDHRGEDVYDGYKCFKTQTDGYVVVKLQQPDGHVEACHDGFCCSVTYSSRGIIDDFYLIVRNGTNNVRKYFYWWEEVCMLTRCDSYEGNECFLQPSRSETVFESVSLKARFTAKAIYPAVSKNKFRLAPKTEWNVGTKDSETTLDFQSDSTEPLLKIGFLGRCYDRDPQFIPFHKF